MSDMEKVLANYSEHKRAFELAQIEYDKTGSAASELEMYDHQVAMSIAGTLLLSIRRNAH